MTLKPPPAATIRFPRGRLHSEILASRDTKFAFFKAGALGAAPTIVPEAEWEENGLGDFSARLVCHISKSTKNATGVLIRITLLLFPVGAETLVAMSDLTAEAYWPGSKILECESSTRHPDRSPGAAPSCRCFGQAPRLRTCQPCPPRRRCAGR